MSKENLLKQVQSALDNGKELDKVKVKFADGSVLKFDFVNEQVEEDYDDPNDDDSNDDDNDDGDDSDDDDNDGDDSDDDDNDGDDKQVGKENFKNILTTGLSGRSVKVINER